MNETRRVIASAVLCLSLAPLLTSCGSDGPSDDPVKSAENYLKAMSENDTVKMCELAAQKSQRYTGPVDGHYFTMAKCESNVSETDGLGDESLADVDIEGEAKVTGNNAIIEVEQLKNLEVDVSTGFQLLRTDDKWYVTLALGTRPG